MPHTLPPFATLTESLLPAVREAGAAIMRYYREEIAVVTKGDGSPTTAADAAAEEILIRALQRLTPSIPVVAEEAASEGHIPTTEKNALWLVDPLDGTREFIKKTDEFTVNLGLIVGGQPVYGIIYAPALDRLFVGYAQTVRRWEKGQEQPMAVLPPYNPQALRVVGSRSHRDAQTEALLRHLPVVSNVSAGSSLKFCLVANGEADFYPRLGRTMEWDTAAGDAILRAMGGHVTLLDGTPLPYNKQNEGFANPSFIAARPEIYWPL